MSNPQGGINVVGDLVTKRFQGKRADGPQWSFGGGSYGAEFSVNSGEASGNAAVATVGAVADNGNGCDMGWDSVNSRLQFAALASTGRTVAMELDSDGILYPGEGIKVDQVRYTTALTNGQTLTYDNTTVANPKAGYFVLSNALVDNDTVTIRGVALRNATDIVFLSTASTGTIDTGEFTVKDVTPNASNASAGFTIELIGAIGAQDLGVFWEIHDGSVVDTTGHSIA